MALEHGFSEQYLRTVLWCFLELKTFWEPKMFLTSCLIFLDMF